MDNDKQELLQNFANKLISRIGNDNSQILLNQVDKKDMKEIINRCLDNDIDIEDGVTLFINSFIPPRLIVDLSLLGNFKDINDVKAHVNCVLQHLLDIEGVLLMEMKVDSFSPFMRDKLLFDPFYDNVSSEHDDNEKDEWVEEWTKKFNSSK